MTLTEYINSIPHGHKKRVMSDIAKKMGVSYEYVRDMRYGDRNIPMKYAVILEKATNGHVRREETAPAMYIR